MARAGDSPALAITRSSRASMFFWVWVSGLAAGCRTSAESIRPRFLRICLWNPIARSGAWLTRWHSGAILRLNNLVASSVSPLLCKVKIYTNSAGVELNVIVPVLPRESSSIR